MKYSIKAPAKINLTLDTLKKRSDGYHEVEMIMTTVDLADRLDLADREDGKIVIDVSEGFVPNDHRNLAYQAADILRKHCNITRGVSIYITKRIPVSAGLAGGSSDAAATLKGLNQLWSLGLSLDELAELGAKIGSDIPFCIYGGTALATGRGEKIEKIASPPPCWVILAKPPIGVSTADIYNRLNVDEILHPNTSEMIRAIENQDFQSICAGLHNTLESVTLDLYPEVKKIKEQMLKFGADGVLMSGSGPTVFGLVQKESRLNRVYNGLKGFCSDVYAVRLLG
ncbi:4-diphosphocytidyl-2C-methyl-D-erythritol kinase [Alkalihalobacillus alcalophilus ATCC 27647 = CGMCC 1.3604]|uniref:4-diphosphocytidyl-2-C-methyl-D-erythritol kinase n=1 Tax=Alkalihalobacillus alcalophilus ATCC 27647 = CGMCC 1.3604 TaxID=1218173 RepID=A0A094WFB0_ALKAL|nr:4-(cytidine 5'-diphospho)-2-C-methyl-D-erythritol kinase [Alkalihalobacillus alcalophilus]KGA96449.1 4-diphosphocytidyl-2C-methyl-D-erythritol kinase [Alkalihalobacillus alcalophilus ATCC 27647 = CGMCC 1.3604]MED1562482.1 4-(cytidine 5'-diphospho)-2-C-methyl-D-erythritol kinase [Alkalihalobacillus alcalophilus]THG88489.1 4-diphosphocytidyl-2C-methyl-D-erythritol kinase [Alkalihalobacillus alcalophilus ATCC 27647 = CGMCC 1.3604]